MNLRLFDLQPVDWSRSQGDLEEETKIEDLKDPIYLGMRADCNILLFGTFGKGAQFLFSQFPEKKLLGCFLFPEIKVEGKLELSKENMNDKVTYVYEYKDIIIILNQHKIPSERCYDFIDVLKKTIAFEKLYIFDTILETDYKSNSLNCPLVLTTNSKFNLFPYFESPNIIQGISAQLLEHSTIFKKDSTLFIVFENQDIWKSFEKIFDKLNFSVEKIHLKSLPIEIKNQSIYI